MLGLGLQKGRLAEGLLDLPEGGHGWSRDDGWAGLARSRAAVVPLEATARLPDDRDRSSLSGEVAAHVPAAAWHCEPAIRPAHDSLTSLRARITGPRTTPDPIARRGLRVPAACLL